jgi:hypothetical protein
MTTAFPLEKVFIAAFTPANRIEIRPTQRRLIKAALRRVRVNAVPWPGLRH